jgi:hypothetical protein
MKPARTFFLLLLTLSSLFALSACQPITATIAPAEVQKTLIAPPGSLPPGIAPTLDLIPDLSCRVESDCVYAYRADRCCDCGAIYSREQVNDDARLSLQYGQADPALCSNVVCAPCQMPPLGLVCDNGTCRAAQSWAEILAMCPQQPQAQQIDWCFVQAAIAAVETGEYDQASAICRSIGTPQKTDNCLQSLAFLLAASNPAQSAQFCEQKSAAVEDCKRLIAP